MHIVRFPVALASLLLMIALAVACGSTGGSDGSEVNLGTPDAGTSKYGDSSTPFQTNPGNDAGFMFTGSTSEGGVEAAAPPPTGPLAIAPLTQTITVAYGQQTPGLMYTANIAGTDVPASFSIDRGEIGSIVAATGALTPGGFIGGTANVTATYGTQ